MEAYVARRRKKNGKNKILVAFVFLLIIASGIILYKFYEKIEVEELDKGSEAVRTLRTLDEEKEEQKEGEEEEVISPYALTKKVDEIGYYQDQLANKYSNKYFLFLYVLLLFLSINHRYLYFFLYNH